MSLPDDQPVRHQSFQNQVKSWISNSLFDKFTYTIRRGPIKVMSERAGSPGSPTGWSRITELPSRSCSRTSSWTTRWCSMSVPSRG
jgi:hypothetical protein